MSAAVANLEDARSRLTSIARDELKKADGNTTQAISGVIRRLMASSELLRELVAPIVIDAARANVRNAHHHARDRLTDQIDGRGRVVALAGGISAALLDFPLQGGVKLREATRSQVMESCNFYQKAGSDMVRKGKWLRAIAQSVPDGKTVGEVMTRRARCRTLEGCIQ